MRILVADDNQFVRRGVIGLLSTLSDCEVCGEASDSNETLEKANLLRPDLVLLDVSMPGKNGLETARLLRQQVPDIKILIMSQYDPGPLRARSLEAGAHGCVDKATIAADLPLAIRKIAEARFSAVDATLPLL